MTKQEFDEAYDNGYKHGYAAGTSELDVLDRIKEELEEARFIDKETKICKNALASGLEVALEIINKYRGE